MKKALLYILLFGGITMVVAFLGLFISGITSHLGIYEWLGISKNDVLVYDLIILYAIWGVAVCWLFVRNGWGSFSLGRLYGRKLWGGIGLTLLLFLAINVVAFWCRSAYAPYTEEELFTMQLYKANPVMNVLSLVTLYTVLDIVFLSAVLRALDASLRHRWVALLIVAVMLSLSNIDGTPAGFLLTAFAAFSALFEGWLYLRTRSIWLSVMGPTVGDFVLWQFFSNDPPTWLAAVSVAAIPLAFWGLHLLMREEA